MNHDPLGTKRRIRTHIMESQSATLLVETLPAEWVVREYQPDYGLDAAVEVFAPMTERGSETLGEHFFIQLKSVERTTTRTLHLSLDNEAAPGMVAHHSEQIDIECISFPLETSELRTIEIMGSAVVVLLVLADLGAGNVYFLCLNDYIDKVLSRNNATWRSQGNSTIHIPIRNRLRKDWPRSLDPIRFYAKRPKMLAAFQYFNLQHHALDWWLTDVESISSYPEDAVESSAATACRTTLANVRHILNWDFWRQESIWGAIPATAGQLAYLESLLAAWGEPFTAHSIPRDLVSSTASGWSMYQKDFVQTLGALELRALVLSRIGEQWRQLANLARIYEQTCRVWFQPTYDGHLLSDLTRANTDDDVLLKLGAVQRPPLTL